VLTYTFDPRYHPDSQCVRSSGLSHRRSGEDRVDETACSNRFPISVVARDDVVVLRKLSLRRASRGLQTAPEMCLTHLMCLCVYFGCPGPLPSTLGHNFFELAACITQYDRMWAEYDLASVPLLGLPRRVLTQFLKGRCMDLAPEGSPVILQPVPPTPGPQFLSPLNCSKIALAA